MINTVIESICLSLNAEFGDRYETFREAKKQDLKEPCFFIQCVNPGNGLFLGKRYFRQTMFCIQYFPETEGKENKECYAVAERLFSCLEYLEVCGERTRGTRMRYEITDGILNFFVNYDMFVRKIGESVSVMETVSSETNAKG